MHRPYSDDFDLTYAVTGCALSTALIGYVWGMLPKRSPSRPLFTASIVGIGALTLNPLQPLDGVLGDWTLVVCLQVALSLATIASFLLPSRRIAQLSLLGQAALLAVSLYLQDSAYETVVLYQAWLGALLGLVTHVRAVPQEGNQPPSPRQRWRPTRPWPDLAIATLALIMGVGIAWFIFDRLTYNGDEIAYTYQAQVFGHFRAYGTPPPCPKMFENYWVFNYQGRLFSQYTPGWPLFMTPFARFRLEWLAGPFSLALLAVGVARLSRRLATGFGASYAREARIQHLAGWLGALTAIFGPAMLLNGGSRFPHTFAGACFAWSVEAVCALPSATRTSTRLSWAVVLGAAAAWCLATRPPDGLTLGVGVFLYFVYCLLRGRIQLKDVLLIALGFAAIALPVAIILRLQLGAWLTTGYNIAQQFHGEAEVRLSWPGPQHWKFGIPLAWGAHMWWPAAPALGLLGMCRALRGPGRNAAWTLGASSLAMVMFYIHVEFSRVSDIGLGPRYLLPLVVPMAAGTGAALAPLFAQLGTALEGGRVVRLVPALVLLSMLAGMVWVAPHVYPLAKKKYNFTTGPIRAARDQNLDNAIVLLFPKQLPADWWNLAQNNPTDPNPKVLFLTRHTANDEACARENFPGRSWYRAWPSGKLTPYP